MVFHAGMLRQPREVGQRFRAGWLPERVEDHRPFFRRERFGLAIGECCLVASARPE